VKPTIDPISNQETDENQAVALTAHVTDPGSDDLVITWDWGDGISTTTTYFNNGISPDPYPSPDINPMNVNDTVSHTYGDNGVFSVVLTVTDDDGAVTTMNITITVQNVNPTIYPFGPFEVDENTLLDVTGRATDPGSDDLEFTWEFELGPTFTTIYYNDGAGPDPYPSPEINPMDVSDMVSHRYGDNCVFKLKLTVTDDDNGEAVYETNITVRNVAPDIVDIQAYVLVNFTLRVAGEKYHSVGVHLMEDDTEVGAATITREPGNPDEQTATLAQVKVDVTKNFIALIDYLPNDPRENGNVWGANPVWLILTFEDGTETRLHHTFNVRKSYWNDDHWNHIDPWEVEINPYISGQNITFEATATDPGSDDLSFVWDFGDSYSAGPNTYFNNGLSPDPYPSPDVNPMVATDTVQHKYTTPGTYTVTLTVTDDDGSSTTITLVLDVL
jgi:PKD repeat protein